MIKKKNNFKDFNGFEGSTELQNELVNSTPREAVIFGVAAIEILIYKLLKTFLIDDKNEVEKFVSLENSIVPLGSFSSKIRACYCLGLISKDEFEDVLIIRDIRNIFAHHIDNCTFEESHIKTACNQFRLANKIQMSKMPTRVQFNVLIYTLDYIIRYRTDLIKFQKRQILSEMIFNK